MTTIDTTNDNAALLAMIAELKAQNTQLKADKRAKDLSRKLTLKVAEKGGLSVYGLGRFPVTLFREQWTKLIAIAPEIDAFILANNSTLKFKGEDAAV